MKDHAQNSKEYFAFEGTKFVIEWYFDPRGRSPALDYFEMLNEDSQVKSLGLFELIGNFGEIKNKSKFNYEGDKLYVFKPQPHRFLCFFSSEAKIIITNAFHKKTNKLPDQEKQRALRYKKDYESRIHRDDYYE